MAKKHLFLVSYIIKGQPQSVEVESDTESLTPDQALYHLQGLHSESVSGDITDVQVMRIVHPHEPGTTPGHHLQP